MLNLLSRLARRHAFFLLFSSVLLGGFQYLMCAMVSTVNVSGAIEELMKAVPPIMRSLVEEELFGGLTLRGLLAFGWNHPVAQALGSAVAIILAARGVAGEIEGGVMELLLSHPLSRVRYFLVQVSFGVASIAVLSIFGILGTIIGQAAFELHVFDLDALLKLAVSFSLLQSSLFGLTLVFSVFGREGGRVASVGFLLAVISYLVKAIGSQWPKASFLLPYSLHNYYSPRAILVEDELTGISIIVFITVFMISVGFSGWRFHQRDIP